MAGYAKQIIRDINSDISLRAINANFDNIYLKVFGNINGNDITTINGTTNIAPGTIDSISIKDAAIDSAKIGQAVIGTAHIADAVITTAKIGDAQITNAKISNLIADRITGDKIAANTIEATSLKADSIEAKYMKAGTITADCGIIANGAITTAMIGTGVIGTTQIADASITDAKVVDLSATSITAGTLSVERLVIVGTDKSIVFAINEANGTAQLSQTTIDGGALTQRTITADRLVAHAITANEIASKTITANEIVAGAITATNGIIASLDAGKITTGTLDASKITVTNLSATSINTGTLDASKMTVTNLTAGSIISGTIDASKITISNNLVVINSSGIEIKQGGLSLVASDGSQVGWFGGTGNGFSKLDVDELKANNVYSTQTTNVTLYVNGSTGNDTNAGTSAAPLKTVAAALRKINKILVGVTCTINIYGTCNETIVVDNFQGSGVLQLYFTANVTVYGSIEVKGCGCYVYINGARTGYNQATLGAVIIPNRGVSAIYSKDSNYVAAYGIRAKCNAADGLVWERSRGYVIYCDISGCAGAGNATIGSLYGSVVSVWDNIGSGNDYWGWVAYGGIITATDSMAIPQYSGTNYADGVVVGNGGKYFIGTYGQYPSQDTSARPATQTIAKQWTATQTDSYRPSGWRSDTNDVYQGQYSSYGIHTGMICFDSADMRSVLSGATINSVKIYMNRKSGSGVSGAVSLHWWGHSYDNTGGGTTLGADYGYNGSLAWGANGWITLPTSVGTALRDGTIKGLALYDGSSNYSIYTGMPILEINYTK